MKYVKIKSETKLKKENVGKPIKLKNDYITLNVISTLYRPELFRINCRKIRPLSSTQKKTLYLQARLANQNIKIIKHTNRSCVKMSF